ncbi:hypothetical protein [Micromonospora maritima]|uniref:hypothetical protein n=1 Tax=Micromonospora maritima TaxID=986711 RepID=UPI0037AC89A2
MRSDGIIRRRSVAISHLSILSRHLVGGPISGSADAAPIALLTSKDAREYRQSPELPPIGPSGSKL